MWEGRDVEDGQRWQTDHSVCTCTSGKVKCQANVQGKKCIYLSVVNSTNQHSEPEYSHTGCQFLGFLSLNLDYNPKFTN